MECTISMRSIFITGGVNLSMKKKVNGQLSKHRAVKIVTQHYEAHGSVDILDINLLSIEKDLQWRLSTRTNKRT
jgi:hypothetical protein